MPPDGPHMEYRKELSNIYSNYFFPDANIAFSPCLFIPFIADRAVPANRECGLYDIPQKKD